MINLTSFIGFHARRTPHAPALVYDGETVDYAEFNRRILMLAAWMLDEGVGPGDVVAVLMRNSAAFLEIAFAVSHLGAIFLPINFRLSSGEVGYIVEDAGARLLFVDDDLVACATAARMVRIDAKLQGSAARLAAGLTPASAHPRTSNDILRLMYTSGTTDRPKGVPHTYENFYFKCAGHVAALGLNAGTRLLVTGPLYHVGAFDLPGVAVLWQGGALIIQRDFDAAGALALIARERVNGAWLAPVMTNAILAQEVTKHDVSSLEWVIGGGERTPESRIVAFAEVFPRARYIDAYGLTETCGGDTLMEAGRELEKIGSTGRAAPHVEVSIRDEGGVELPAGMEGEICLRGPKVFKGYWRDARKTAESFFDGWFRSGDVGWLDEEGFLFVTDRRKDMIISGGENIAASEVERVLQLMPQIVDVAVVGAPDARWGECAAAVVILRDGAVLDLAMVREHCRPHLAPFKWPRRLVVREALPRNPSGKVLKRELREALRADNGVVVGE